MDEIRPDKIMVRNSIGATAERTCEDLMGGSLPGTLLFPA